MKYPQVVSMPSAISDWLEEQLEARGIDSEVYTRYILSLLHAHTLDVIYPEDDLPFSGLKKDGRRSAVSHKRIRRTGTWWRHAHADAEQIKRSAAVECLTSAAEQSCEIESLVDELCEKLKEVNSEGNDSPNKIKQDPKIIEEPLVQRKISPKELAEKYYAAFPPLTHKEENSYFSSNINLVAGKWPSPNKNHIDLIAAAKWTTSGSPKKTKRKPKRQLYETTMKPTCRTDPSRCRFGCKRTHSGRNVTKKVADNIANWDLVCNNNNFQIPDQTFDFDKYVAEKISEDSHDKNDNVRDTSTPLSSTPFSRMEDWLRINATEDDVSRVKRNPGPVKETRPFQETDEYLPLYKTDVWSYEHSPPNRGWPVGNDIPQYVYEQNGLSMPWSLEGEASAVREEYQRLELEVETAIKPEYDRWFDPYGHSQAKFDEISDISSDRTDWRSEKFNPFPFDKFELDFGLSPLDELERLRDELSTIESDPPGDPWPPLICARCSEAGHWFCGDFADITKFFDLKSIFDDETISLMKVNHDMHGSAFRPYIRPENFDFLPRASYSPCNNRQWHTPVCPDEEDTWPPLMSEEQKKNSPHMFFQPIKGLPLREVSKEENSNRLQDGTTFNIKSTFDRVPFQRSATGTLMIKTDLGECRKYFEYNWRPLTDPYVGLLRLCTPSECEEFRVKYMVSSNDKACQTDILEQECPENNEACPDVFEALHSAIDTGDSGDEFENEVADGLSFQNDIGGELENEEIIADVQENVDCAQDEAACGYAVKISNMFCKCCHVTHPWPNYSAKSDFTWDERALKNIWGETKEDNTCPWSIKRCTPTTTPAVNTITFQRVFKNEGEIVFTDVRTIERQYFERLRQAQLKSDDGPSEKKRRHSYMSNDTDLWSFATRLQEDCMISLSTLPTRRSVTL